MGDLKFNNARLQGPALGLILALVAFADVHALHGDPAFFGENFYRLTPLSLVIAMARDDLDNITATVYNFTAYSCTVLRSYDQPTSNI